jgi:hypothetical protein
MGDGNLEFPGRSVVVVWLPSWTMEMGTPILNNTTATSGADIYYQGYATKTSPNVPFAPPSHGGHAIVRALQRCGPVRMA